MTNFNKKNSKKVNKAKKCTSKASKNQRQQQQQVPSPLRNQTPTTVKSLQARHDSYRDNIPEAIVTERANVTVPECWPPGLIFTGENNVPGWPAIDDLPRFYMTHNVQVNEGVRIKPSPGRGLGCYANKNFKKGSIVGFYSGNLRRQQTSHLSQYVTEYRPMGSDRTDEWEIDAEFGGSEMRFANYPNDDENPK